MPLTKKQIKDLQKANDLMKKAKALFEISTTNVEWCPMYGQTESAFSRLESCLEGYAQYKSNPENNK